MKNIFEVRLTQEDKIEIAKLQGMAIGAFVMIGGFLIGVGYAALKYGR